MIRITPIYDDSQFGLTYSLKIPSIITMAGIQTAFRKTWCWRCQGRQDILFHRQPGRWFKPSWPDLRFSWNLKATPPLWHTSYDKATPSSTRPHIWLVSNSCRLSIVKQSHPLPGTIWLVQTNESMGAIPSQSTLETIQCQSPHSLVQTQQSLKVLSVFWCS